MIIHKIALSTVFFVHGPALFSPICYAVFGFPSPEQWKQTIPIKWNEKFTSTFSKIHNFSFCFREFLDSKTYLGVYISSFTSTMGGLIYFFFTVASIGFFTGLSVHTNATFEDFKETFSKLNIEIIRDAESSSNSRERKNDLNLMFREVILLHNDMHKYVRLHCNPSNQAKRI